MPRVSRDRGETFRRSPTFSVPCSCCQCCCSSTALTARLSLRSAFGSWLMKPCIGYFSSPGRAWLCTDHLVKPRDRFACFWSVPQSSHPSAHVLGCLLTRLCPFAHWSGLCLVLQLTPLSRRRPEHSKDLWSKKCTLVVRFSQQQEMSINTRQRIDMILLHRSEWHIHASA